MTTEPQADLVPPAPEAYMNRGNPVLDAHFLDRTALKEAAFFLPYLRPGLRVLDCGCGPGAITLGLADAVMPGEVVGIDAESRQVDAARVLARDRGSTSARFELGDIYQLPFPDGSFDAAFAHTVLMHLRDPLRALREMRRVVKPGGVVGLRDIDVGSQFLAPALPFIEESFALRSRVTQHNGSPSAVARHHRGLLLEAGFARADGRAVLWCDGSSAATRANVQAWLAWSHGPVVAETVAAQGWADSTMLETMRTALDQWSQRPDAFLVMIACETVGWVGEEPGTSGEGPPPNPN